MTTIQLSRTREQRALIVVMEKEAEGSLFELLHKGFPRTSRVWSPKDLIDIARREPVDIVVLSLAAVSDEDAALLRALREGPACPGVILVTDKDLRREVAALLPAEHRPDLVLARPVPFAKLVQHIGEILGARRSTLQTRGNPEGPSFAEILAYLWRRQRTGVLRILAEGVQTNIYLRLGEPVFAEQGTLGDHLGRMLIESGKISQEDFARAVEVITERLVDNEQLRLGEVLIELGLLTPGELHQALTEQVQRKILTCFAWSELWAELLGGEELSDSTTSFDNPVPRLLWAGIRDRTPAALVDRFLAPLKSRYPRLRLGLPEVEHQFGLGGKERRLLDELDGRHTIQMLAESSTMGGSLLMALFLGGAVVLYEAPGEVSARPAAADALPVPVTDGPSARSSPPAPVPAADSTGSDVEAAACAPDPAAAAARPEMTPEVMLQDLRQTLERAAPPGETAAPEQGKTAPRKRDKLQAEQEFQRGRYLLRQGQLRAAAEMFLKATERYPDAVEYELFAAWLAYRQIRDPLQQPVMRERLTALARRMLKEDREHAKAHLILGELLAERTEYAQAATHLRRASASDPDDIDVQQALRLLRARMERK